MRGKAMAVALAMAVLIGAAARAQMDEGLQEILLELESTMYPPMLFGLEVSPANPGPNQPVKVTAVIHNERDLTDDMVIWAEVRYSTDGGASWSFADLGELGDGVTWRGEIPGQPAGTEVLYYLWAEDTAMNVYTELACLVDGEWPPMDHPCLFSGAGDETSSFIEESFDIVGVWVGEDDDYFYIQVRVKGDIWAGTASPVFLAAYGGALENPDRRGQDVLERGIAFIYGPLAKLMNFDTCLTVYQRGGDVVYGPDGVECAAAGSNLMFRLEKDFIGPNPSNWIKFIAATAVITDFNIEALPVIPKDYTHFTRVHRVSRSYTVAD